MSIKKRLDQNIKIFSLRINRLSISKNLTKPSLITSLKTKGLEITYFGIISLLIAGIVNALLEGLNPNTPQAFISVSRSVQTLGETILNVFSIGIGTFGLFLIFKSNSSSSKHRVSNFYFIAGLITILLSITISLYILGVKRF